MASSEFQSLEDTEAVRMSWNIWPISKVEATKCVIPFAALYTPCKQLANLQVNDYEPVPCKSCGSILNPYARCDFTAKIWICPHCHTRNHFPAHYQAVAEHNLPAELFPQCTTIEYKMQRHNAPVVPPTYLFIIDTCVPEDELAACKSAVLHALELIPEYCLIGLVTFGTHVHVHELGFTECPKSYVFHGSKTYTSQQVTEQLGLQRGLQQRGQSSSHVHAQAGRFLQPLSECEFMLTNILEELQRDAFPSVTDFRPARATGTAVQVSTALLGACLPMGGSAARACLLVGGPATEGPGVTVGRESEEEIRSHKDLAKDEAPHFRKSSQFYSSIATDLVMAGHTLDVFACALEQVGLAEMKKAVAFTGGMVVQTDSFSNPVLKESFKRVFAQDGAEGFLGLSCNATFEVISSKDVKVAGVLGPAAPSDKKGGNVSEVEVGVGKCSQWKLCSLNTSTTLAVVFDITATNKDPQETANAAATTQQFFVQFITKYLHWSGEHRCRVTTLTRRWVDGSNPADLMQGFDQEAAAVLMARIASWKMETEEDFDATRWLDRNLIRLAQRFGEYRKDDTESFNLVPNMSFYPQFMFNLRRSQFVQVFGNSPDETAYFRILLNHEPVGDAMTMIQPQLTAFHFNGPPEPVLLDVSSIRPDHILLLDAFFHVVVFHGSQVGSWRKAKYHESEEYADFAHLLRVPQEEAMGILQKRFPVPRLVDCDQNGSQARFLLAKLNPSSTYSTQDPMSGEVINTDDVSLAVFTDHLKKLAVQS